MTVVRKISSTWLMALTIVLIGLGLMNVFVKPGRKNPPTAPAQPKPAPASTPKRPSHKSALANNSGLGKPRLNALREFEPWAISAEGWKKQRFGNPKGIVSFSPGLLARWDKLVDRFGIAKPEYPTGRETSYPGLTQTEFSTPTGLRRISAAEPQPRWGSLPLAHISQGSSFLAQWDTRVQESYLFSAAYPTGRATLGFVSESLFWDSSLVRPLSIFYFLVFAKSSRHRAASAVQPV